MDCSTKVSLSFTISQSFLRLRFMSTDAIQPSHLLSPSSPLALNLYQNQGLFQWFCSSHQVAKVLELQFQYQSFQWIFRVDFLKNWLFWSPYSPRDCQESLQHHTLKASSFWCSAFLMVQLSHPYMTTRKTITLIIGTFVSKVMPLLFNMLSRFVIAFLPRSNHLLISKLQAPSAVILECKKIKSVMASTFSPFVCQEVMGPGAKILVFWMLTFKSSFSLSSFTLIKKFFSSSSLSAIRVVSSAYLRLSTQHWST